MKKIGVFAILVMILLSFSFILAAEDNETESDTDDGENQIEEAFSCLEEKAGTCTKLTTEELAFTILATPDNVFDDCVKELESREDSGNWDNVKDTALAILALQHAGKDTSEYEEWLLEQEEIPTELIWYAQIDANEATECHIGYESKDYTIEIGENKKIDVSAGACLSPAQSNFWLQIDNDCYNKDFNIQCDKDFIASLLYKNSQSSTIYVLEGTQSAPAYESIDLSVKSKCFGENKCDYEGSIWATLALLKTEHDIEDYIPYIIAISDTNERYLPEAFVYMLTNYEDYATKLVSEQKLGNFWEADLTANNKYYDTALALLALGSSSADQVDAARDWLLFSQATNGCWHNSITDTAIVLWALEGRSGRSLGDGGNSVTYCTTAGYFCIPSTTCLEGQNVGENYFCPSLSDTCCTTENLQTCDEYGGQVCSESTFCNDGIEKKATDTNKCCTGICQERPTETECESNFYNCYDSCSNNQEATSDSCDGGQVCCKFKAIDDDESLLWLWILLGFIILLSVLAYVYRDKLKAKLNKLKSKKSNNGGPRGPNNMPPGRPGFPPRGMPPRPGFPPVVRQAPPRPGRPRPGYKDDPAMKETFRKLRRIATR